MTKRDNGLEGRAPSGPEGVMTRRKFLKGTSVILASTLLPVYIEIFNPGEAVAQPSGDGEERIVWNS